METKKEKTLEIRFEHPNPPGRLEQLLRKLLRTGKPSWNPWKTKSGSLRILQKNKATNW